MPDDDFIPLPRQPQGKYVRPDQVPDPDFIPLRVQQGVSLRPEDDFVPLNDAGPEENRIWQALKAGLRKSTPGVLAEFIKSRYEDQHVPEKEFETQGALETAAKWLGEFGPDVPLAALTGGFGAAATKGLGTVAGKFGAKKLAEILAEQGAKKAVLGAVRKEGLGALGRAGAGKLASAAVPMAVEGAASMAPIGAFKGGAEAQIARNRAIQGEALPDVLTSAGKGLASEAIAGAIGGPLFEVGGQALGRTIEKNVTPTIKRGAQRLSDWLKPKEGQVDLPSDLGSSKKPPSGTPTNVDATVKVQYEEPLNVAQKAQEAGFSTSEAERLPIMGPGGPNYLKDAKEISGTYPRRGGINSPEERQMANDVLKATAESTKQWRASRSWADTREAAARVGIDTSGGGLKIDGIEYKPGIPLTDEQVVKVLSFGDELLKNATEKNAALKKAIPGTDTYRAAKTAFDDAFSAYMMFEPRAYGVGATPGRQLNLERMFKKPISRMDNEIRKRFKFVTPEEFEGLQQSLAKARLETNQMLSEGKPWREAFDPMAKVLNDFHSATWLEKAIETSVLFKLLNPVTQARNVIGNTAFAVTRVAEKALAGGMDFASHVVTGSERRVYAREAVEDLKGWVEGARQAVREMIPALLNDSGMALKGQEIMVNTPAVKGLWGQALRAMTSRPLAAADIFFQRIAQRGAVRAEIFRRLAKQGIKPGTAEYDKAFMGMLTDLPEDIADKAAAEGVRRVFQGSGGSMAGILQGMEKLRSEHPALRLIFPFVKTPLNIFQEGMARTPIGFLSAAKAARNGLPAEEVIDKFASAMLGSSVGTVLFMGVNGGNVKLTGANPRNRQDKELRNEVGIPANSVKIGDTWHTYMGFEPMSTILAMTAAASDALDQGDMKTFEEKAAQLTSDIARYSTDQTFMTGLNSLVRWLDDPENQVLSKNFLGFMLKGAIVPTGVQQTAKVIDPKLKRRADILEEVAEGLPGVRQALPNKLGLMGKDVTLPSGIDTLLKPRKESEDPVLQELYRLNKSVGLRLASEPSTKGGVRLKSNEVNEFQGNTGRVFKSLLDKLMADKIQIPTGGKYDKRVMPWSRMNDLERQDAVKKLQEKVRNDFSKAVFTKERAVLRAVDEEQEPIKKKRLLADLLKKGEIDPREYAVFSQVPSVGGLRSRLDERAKKTLKRIGEKQW